MKTKHTPGPWTAVQPHGNNVGMRIFADDEYLGFIGNSDRDQEWANAIARLIAAAPEMYEALKAARAILQATGEWQDPIIREQVEIIKKAIDKAEGGEG